ncbi:transcriptional regulator, AsnC family, partial [mine drainage metagenome]
GFVIPSRVKHITKRDFEALKSIDEAKERLKIAESEEQEEASQVSRYEEIILESLSSDGRISLKELSGRLGVKTTAAEHQLRKVEGKYGIRYIAELNLEKLGYQKFMAFVKFIGEPPGSSTIKEALEPIPEIQLVAGITGEYRLLVYFFSPSNKDVAYLIHHIRTATSMREYKAEWYVAPFFDDYGFVPVRDEFFHLLSNRIWKRTKENPRPGPNSITHRQYSVLRELAKDASMTFTSIDMKNGFEPGASRYTFESLLDKGYIKRITIAMEKLFVKYAVILSMRILEGLAFDNCRKYLLEYIVSNAAVSNRFALVGDIEMPYSVMFIMPSFNDGDVETAREHIKSNIKGVETEVTYITGILIGKAAYRRLPREDTHQYLVLKEEYKME